MKTKKILAVALAVIMLLSSAPLGGFVGLDLPDMFKTEASAASYDGMTYTVSNGKVTITDCDASKSGEVVIPDTINGYPVTSIGYAAFYYCKSLTSVEIPDSVTSIGNLAFCDCKSLTSIKIPDSVTSIGDRAFLSCDSLTSIFVNSANMNYSSDSYGVLYNKNKTELIQYPIGNSRKSFVIPNSVTSIGDGAFEYCKSLTSIKIPNSVTSIGDYAFYSCYSLTSVEIPDSVTSIGNSAFYWCGSLTSVTIPDSVTSIGNEAFRCCWRLTSISVSEKNKNYSSDSYGVLYNKDKTTLIQHPIGNSRTSFIIPDSVTSIGDRAFEYCRSLTSVTIPDSVTSIGKSAFYDCDRLTSIFVNSANMNYSSDSNGVLYNKDKTTLIQYPIGNSRTSFIIPDSVRIIGGSAFCYCNSLTSVEIPDSVTSIGDYAFYWCDSLTSVKIGNSVTSIGDCAFYECNSLTSIEIPDSVTSIGYYAFYRCERLTSVTIGNSVTSIGDGAFEYCRSLTDVYYSGSEEQWSYIKIGADNSNLLNANIHYNSSEDEGSVYFIHAYCNKPNLIIGEDGSLEISFQLICNSLHGTNLKSGATFSFTASDNDIFSIEKIDAQSKYTKVTLNGQHSGTGILTASAYYNGEFKFASQFRITVTGETVYFAESMPDFGDYNIECNGITIDNFVYRKEDSKTSTISFDAYNQQNCYGAVEVYDKDGKLLFTQSIDRFSGNLLPTGFFDIGAEILSVHKFNSDYKNEEYSQKTSIYLHSVPRDGHVVISNDIANSQACAIYNISNLAINAVLEGISLSKYVDDKAVGEEVTKNVGQKVLDIMLNTTSATLKKSYQSMLKDVLSKVNLGTEKGMNKAIETYILFLDEIGIDLGQLIIDTLKKSLPKTIVSTLQNSLLKLLGAPGILTKVVFEAISVNNLLQQGVAVGKNANSGNVCIYCTTPYEEVRYSNGFAVRSDSSFDENASFHTYKIVNTAKYDEVQQKFEEKVVQLFAMSLYQDGKEVQPTGTVTVAIPVPKGINVFDMRVYREEEDGTFTKLNFYGKDDGYTLDDGYIYITTEHFSLYCITGETDNIQHVSFDEPIVNMSVNDTFIQYPTFIPEISSELIDNWNWSSSNEEVAKITDSGIVSAVGVGTTTISALDGQVSYTVNVTPHIHDYTHISDFVTQPTCTEAGESEKVVCLDCGYVFEASAVIPALGHTDKDNDGICDVCRTVISPEKNCSHLCHKDGFAGFIWKFINLFNKLFKINQYCECGAKHW